MMPPPMPASDELPFRILIVDDEEPILRVVDRMLRAAGYHTLLANSAFEALALAKAGEAFDLLLTDLMMPGMSGEELARDLHQQRPFLKVLYLTGFSDRLFALRPTLSSNEAYLDKPVSTTSLREAVSLTLSGHVRGLPSTDAEPTKD
jgi:two-component system cell cycle sensor histidine kinase/response regulator CckA